MASGVEPLPRPESPQLTPSQRDAVRVFQNTRRNMYVYGNGGTGKSFLMRHLQNLESQRNNVYAAVAYTGSAAFNVNGITVARMFVNPPGVRTHRGWVSSLAEIEAAVTTWDSGNPEFYLPGRGLNGTDYMPWNQLKTLFIDEISMLDVAYLEMMNRRLQVERHNNLPFGGVRLIVTGDFGQLRPFEGGGSSTGLYAFQEWPLSSNPADVRRPWAAAGFVPCKLREQMRANEDTRLQIVAEHARSGVAFKDWPESVKRLLLERTFDRLPESASDVTHAFWANASAAKRNAEMNASLPGPCILKTSVTSLVETKTTLTPTEAVAWGDAARMTDEDQRRKWAEVRSMYKDVPWAPDASLEIKENSKIMLSRNIDQPTGRFNGATAVVLGLAKRGREDADNRRLRIALDATGQEYDLATITESVTYGRTRPNESWKLILDGDVRNYAVRVEFIWTFYPIVFGWAISYHKLQGKTLPGGIVAMVAKRMDANMAYTAITRATNLGHVYIAPDFSRFRFWYDSLESLLNGAITTDPDALEFMRSLERRENAGRADDAVTAIVQDVKTRAGLVDPDAVAPKPACQCCCAKQASVAMLPCAHVFACIDCDTELVRRKCDVCPMCRATVLGRTHLFYAD